MSARTKTRRWLHPFTRLFALLSLFLASEGRTEPLVLVSPLFDQNDRLEETLRRLEPAVAYQRIGLDLQAGRRDGVLRALGETEPARLEDARLVIVENATPEAMRDVRVAGGGRLFDALPRWVRRGGHLLIVGGYPSFDTYGGALAEILPVAPAPDVGARMFRRTVRRTLHGGGAEGTHVDHLHPVRRVTGDILIRAEDEPFATARKIGAGRVVAVVGGIHEQLRPDEEPDPSEYFASPAWPRFVAQEVERAILSPVKLAPPPPDRGDVPTVRRGARVNVGDWFPEVRSGSVSLFTPAGEAVQDAEIEADGSVGLSDELRPGIYSLRVRRGGETQSRRILVGEPADLRDFDIRFFSLSSGPNPYGYAPGEAYARARKLEAAGFTSAVFSKRLARHVSDLRALREIAQAGLQIVYQLGYQRETGFPRKWPFSGRAPYRARDLSGKEVGWDVHDDAFRAAATEIFDARHEDLALPGLRALMMFEEMKDGGMQSPSLAPEMRRAGLRGEEKPGEPGWLRHEEIRSTATGITFQRWRAEGKRRLPSIPQATYWPGSYWGRPRAYSFRVQELALAVDELLGPAYGYGYSNPDTGWIGARGTPAEIFAAFGHRIEPGRGFGVYAQGRSLGGSREPIDETAWMETGWTALAHGATSLAYWAIPLGRSLDHVRDFHREVTRIGPWIAAARRRPAKVAVLGSWTTRTAGTDEEVGTHARCIGALYGVLTRGIEEVDLILEEQLDAPPRELRAIVLTAAPVLTDRTIESLGNFARRGGLLLLDHDSGKRRPDGGRRSDPWSAARSSDRVVEVGIAERCLAAGNDPVGTAARWRDRFSDLGIEPDSVTPGFRTEARLLGDDEIRYWILLNHETKAAQVAARSRLAADGFTWVDLRKGGTASPRHGSGMQYSTRIPGRDAAILLGVRNPAAHLELTVRTRSHQILISAGAHDASGRPVADGYPLHLQVRGQDDAPRLRAAARSRVTKDGTASWVAPIPLEEEEKEWFLRLEDPVSGLQSTATVPIPPLKLAESEHAPSPEDP